MKTLKIGVGIEPIDFYSWLPGYGENSVRIQESGKNLSILITYDTDNGERMRELSFLGVSEFNKSSFPGPDLSRFEYDKNFGNCFAPLLEFKNSEAALAWTDHYNNGRVLSHYRLLLMGENLQVFVIAENFILSEERSLCEIK